MNSLTIKANQINEVGFLFRAKNLSADASIRFVIHTPDHDVSVKCKESSDQDKWIAVIPALNLTESEVKYDIEVITEEYYYRPTSGTMKVIRTPSLEVGKPSMGRPELSIEIQESTVTGSRTLLEYTEMRDDDKKSFIKSVRSVSKILETAATVLKSLTTDQGKLNSKSVLAITEASKTAISGLEDRVWKK
jgi:hypothetical protein